MIKTIKSFIFALIGAVIIYVILLSASIHVNAETSKNPTTAYVYIGDSRTVGMNDAVDLVNMKDTFVVAKSGMGYNWFMKEGSEELYKIRETHKYDNWVYIFNLGVNDLYNVENYVNLYKELSNEATVYYLSINPTDDSVGGIQCKDIEKFNKKIRIGKTVEYIDSYDYLSKVSGYTFDKRQDGMHYSEETYTQLFEFIKLSIEVREFVDKNDGRYSAYFYLYNYR